MAIPIHFQSVMCIITLKYTFTAQKCQKASFCVIDQDHIVPDEYTTYFRSAIAFGSIRIIENETEKQFAIEKLAIKYFPEDSFENRTRTIKKEWKHLCLIEFSIEHITGKQAIELISLK